MFSVPSKPGENLRKVCENSRGDNTRIELGFSLICTQILPNVLGFHQTMMQGKHVLFLN